MAYELLPHLTPELFWELTPGELNVMLKGARKREEKVWWRTAWTVAHLMNVSSKYVKQPVSAAKLLGKVVGGSNE